MRLLFALLLLAPLARADLQFEVRRAFRADDPEQRIIGLRAARAALSDADVRARNAAAAQIEKAIKKEDVPEVRMAAMDFLLALRTDRALDRLVVGVLDRSERVRTHVHAIVRDHADSALFETITRTLKEDASWRMRAAMVDLLLSGARERARRPLIAALDDEHPGVRSRAAEALFRMTGQPLGLDKAKWEAWFKQQADEQAKRVQERRTTTDTRKVELVEGPVRGLNPTLYGIPIIEKQVVFVVDMSNSMSKNSRSSHFVELKKAIFSLPSDVSFNVLCFDERLFFFTGASNAKKLVPASTPNKAKCERWLNDLPAGGKTDVHRSLTTGLAMLRESLLKDSKSKAELFILTDGRETKKTTSLRTVERQYEKLPQARCRLHVISLGGRTGTPALKVLAQASGGHFVETPRR